MSKQAVSIHKGLEYRLYSYLVEAVCVCHNKLAIVYAIYRLKAGSIVIIAIT